MKVFTRSELADEIIRWAEEPFSNGELTEGQKNDLIGNLVSERQELLAENAKLQKAWEEAAALSTKYEAELRDIDKIKADAVRSARECAGFFYKARSFDFETGFDQAIDRYDRHLEQYANKLEGKEE